VIKKIIGWILLGIGLLGAAVLLTYGGPVFPHIFGPSIVVVIGAVMLLFKQKVK
jgi:hypothetical protein